MQPPARTPPRKFRPVHVRRAAVLVLFGCILPSAPLAQVPDDTRACSPADGFGTPLVMVAGGSTAIRVFLDPYRATLEIPWELSSFCMQAVPVTREAWARMHTEQTDMSDELAPGRRPRDPHDPELQQPVTEISQLEAAAYCTALGGRLPTETEWEFAAAGSYAALRNAWTADDLLDAAGIQSANFAGDTDGFPGLAPVTAFSPRDFGLFDMFGNAAEWTSTPEVFDPLHWSIQFTSTQADDRRMVFKGGSYEDDPTATRHWTPRGRAAARADERMEDVGFRCVFEPLSR